MFRRRTHLFSKEEIEAITEVIRQCEAETSGEIRLFIERRCAYMDPIDRAKELFLSLQMQQTVNRNGVLIYIAFVDHDFAILGDRNIYQAAPPAFWQAESKALSAAFHRKDYRAGITHCIQQVGNLLSKHFPPHHEAKNELPDDIIFGK